MKFSVEAGLFTINFELVLSLALAAVALFAGYFVQRRVGFLSRANIPAAAVGGLLFAGLVFALRAGGVAEVRLDTSLRAPLQTVFFTTIGLGATTALLRAGGWRTGFFWLLATLTAVVQNVVGMALAVALGAPALLGVICGALTLTGGPATGLAWAGRFKSLGISGADSIIAASAMFGIFTSSLVGNPVATALIRRRRLAPRADERVEAESEFWALSPTIAPDEENEGASSSVDDESVAVRNRGEELSAGVLLHNLLLVLVVMGVGAVVGLLLTSGVNALLNLLFGSSAFVLPDYIGAMVVAAVVRNVDDRTGGLVFTRARSR